jgi:hypothetical protein
MPPRLLLQNLCQGPLHGDTGSPLSVTHDHGRAPLRRAHEDTAHHDNTMPVATHDHRAARAASALALHTRP